MNGEPPVEQERPEDQTGANKFDAEVAKALERKEMWKAVQAFVDNAGKVAGLLGLILAGYATCTKADASDTERQLQEQKGKIEKTKAEVKEAKAATGKVLEYTTAVASSAEAAVAAVASAPSPPPVHTAPPPAGSAGCWVSAQGGVVRCKSLPAPAKPIVSTRMPAPPDLLE